MLTFPMLETSCGDVIQFKQKEGGAKVSIVFKHSLQAVNGSHNFYNCYGDHLTLLIKNGSSHKVWLLNTVDSA